ncbi:MAG: ABC transporter ATP-binding protein [Phycisphaerales bacterium]
MTPLLHIEDLAVSFSRDDGAKKRRAMAVDGLRLKVYPGQTVAVVGESGCGKSVSAMSILRLLPEPNAKYERGRILFDRGGTPADLLTLHQRELRKVRGGEIAMIFQEPMTSLNPVYTVGDQILEAIHLHQGLKGKKAVEAAVRAMERVGIRDARSRIGDYPHQYSGGMRQRVMIAMALACEPKLLIADEPTTALDVTVQAQILELLDGIRREREMAMLLITHDLGIVAERADAVCVVYNGRVVEFAPTAEIFASPRHPYTRGLFSCIPTMDARRERLTTVKQIVEDESQFKGLKRDGEPVRPWWPWHKLPKKLVPADDAPSEYLLATVTPGHWVGLWRTDPLADTPRESPGLAPSAAGAAS